MSEKTTCHPLACRKQHAWPSIERKRALVFQADRIRRRRCVLLFPRPLAADYTIHAPVLVGLLHFIALLDSSNTERELIEQDNQVASRTLER